MKAIESSTATHEGHQPIRPLPNARPLRLIQRVALTSLWSCMALVTVITPSHNAWIHPCGTGSGFRGSVQLVPIATKCGQFTLNDRAKSMAGPRQRSMPVQDQVDRKLRRTRNALEYYAVGAMRAGR
ncbi:MAG: hypothetical protein RLZ83_1029 [Pseudomonadota bacterium]